MSKLDRISVLSVPYDTGVTFRAGAAEGPAAILNSIWKGLPGGVFRRSGNRKWLTTGKIVQEINNLHVQKKVLFYELTSILREAVAFTSHEAFPIILGGDHSVTAGSYLGVSSILEKETGLLIFDAHVDCWKKPQNGNYNHSSYLRYLINEEGIRGDSVVIVGVRGMMPDEVMLFAQKHGINVIEMEQIHEQNFDVVLEQALSIVSRFPAFYLSIDIDCLDPCYAPGTGVPEWGGLKPQHLFRLIERVCSTKTLVGLDIVEVAPPLDGGNSTQLLAAEILWRFFLLLGSKEL